MTEGRPGGAMGVDQAGWVSGMVKYCQNIDGSCCRGLSAGCRGR